jgi:hypothetical protein
LPPPRATARSAPEPKREAPEETPEVARDIIEVEPPPRAWSAERTAQAVAEVSELRAKGRYLEASRLIEQLLQAPLAARAAEVLSFERGEILEHKLSLHADACAHWRTHQQRFAGGRYEIEVRRALELCKEAR